MDRVRAPRHRAGAEAGHGDPDGDAEHRAAFRAGARDRLDRAGPAGRFPCCLRPRRDEDRPGLCARRAGGRGWQARHRHSALRLSGERARTRCMSARRIEAADFDIKAPAGANEVRARVIGVIENQAPTKALEADLPVEDGLVAMDRANDVCQIAVVERHGHRQGGQRASSRASATSRIARWPRRSRMTATT